MIGKKYKNKDWLKEQYIDLRKSDNCIAKELGVSDATIWRWRNKFGIKARSTSESIRESKKGKIPWNKGKKRSEETKRKISESKKGEKSYQWKGGRYIDSVGYVNIHKPNHPNAHKKGYVLEHRFVMESFLKQFLEPENIVHHRDGNRQNNRLANLVLFKNHSEHTKYHHKIRGKA